MTIDPAQFGLDDADVSAIHTMLRDGYTPTYIAARFNVQKWVIHALKWPGYRWDAVQPRADRR